MSSCEFSRQLAAPDAATVESERVTVIVPVYNSRQTLPLCMDSILRQSHADLEIILIDDGSTDSSRALCDEYARTDRRISVVHTPNRGPAAARNLGLERATGSFILFADSDDFLSPGAVEQMLAAYRRCRADVIIGDCTSITGGFSATGLKGSFNESTSMGRQDLIEYARNYLRRPNKFSLFAYAWGRLFRTSVIRKHNLRFDQDLRTFEDVAFNFAYLRHADTAFFLKTPVYNHVVHGGFGSATMSIGDSPERMLGYQKALVSIGGFLEQSAAAAQAPAELAHAYVSLTIIQLIRICGQLSWKNRAAIVRLVRGLVNEPAMACRLARYSPSPGDSRTIPLLLGWKLVWPLILVCRYKALKRYRTRTPQR